MNIRQLIIFKTVCKNLSFTATAKELYMSQPAISHAIGDLEKQLGCTLLDRINHKIYINDAGLRFLHQASQIIELYDHLENHFNQETTTLKIGSSITIATLLLPSLIKDFKKEHPSIEMQVTVDSAKNIETKLLNNEVDLALIEGSNQHPLCVYHTFSSFNLIVVCSPKHPYAKKKNITIDEFVQADVLLREQGSAIRSCIDSAMLLQNKTLVPTWTSVNSQVLIQATKNNLGITVLPEPLLTNELKNNTLKKVEIKNLSLLNHNHIVYHKDKVITPTLQSFIQHIIK